MGTTSAAARRLPVAVTLGCAAAVALAGCADAQANSAQAPAVGGAAAAQPRVSAGVVTFTENLGVNAHGKRPPAPVTIVSKAKAGRIAALINRQGLFPQNVTYNCPNDDLQSLMLTFRGGVGGPVVETATLATSGCQLIDITVEGKGEPLRGPALGRRIAAQAIKIAGLDWKLPAIG